MIEDKEEIKVLSPAQAKLLGMTVSVTCVFALFALITVGIQYLGDFLGLFSAVLWPLAVACILGILLSPLVRSISKKTGFGPSVSILMLYLLVVLTAFFVLWGFGGEVIRQYRELASTSVEWPERIEENIEKTISPDTWSVVSQKFHSFKSEWKQGAGSLADGLPEISQHSANALKSAWSNISSFFTFFACLAIVPVYLFYFLASKRDYLAGFAEQISFLNADMRNDLVYLIRQFKDILEGFFRGQFLIGAMMGIGYAIGFSISGLKFGMALGLFFGVLNVVPYLGTILGVVSVLLVSYLQPGGILESGQWQVLWGCGISFIVVQFLESYWLSPKVMGDRTGLHPVLIIASVFFWGTAFNGILGMILGIPLTAFLIVFWRLMRKKYLCSVTA